ncbi:MAG TPA: ATP-binding protein [Ramlibacter sp.]|nr:ATP-binding protein [Ramlibacter sp.]
MSEGRTAAPQPAPILVHAPGRDGELTARLLVEAGHPCRRCLDDAAFAAALSEPLGAVLLAAETLTAPLVATMQRMLRAQPPWSDLPVIVVEQRDQRLNLKSLAMLGNVSVLTRPMSPESLASAAAAALRARHRQFEVRDLLRSQQDQARRKDEFLAMLAHELRNPLAPVRYAATLLQREELPLDRRLSLARLLERQVGHMGSVIDQLLDVTRVTRGTVEIRREPVDLAQVVRHAVDALGSTATERQVRLAASVQDGTWVDGDPTRLEQVCGNLLHNAIKFSPTGAQVQVEAGFHGEGVVLRVVDRGEGIDAEVLPFLFEPFMQADRSLDRARGGLGLGLALVKGLVQLHGGRVEVHSPGKGQGSTFTVHLPRGRTAPAPADGGAAQAALDGNRRRVLIVEDNPDAADTLRMVLEVSGHEVSVAHSGPAGLEAARRQRPDAIICDIGLPGLSGYELARALRKEPEHAGTLLVAVTGYGRPEDVAAARASGFDRHFAKPVAAKELLAVLEGPAAG